MDVAVLPPLSFNQRIEFLENIASMLEDADLLSKIDPERGTMAYHEIKNLMARYKERT